MLCFDFLNVCTCFLVYDFVKLTVFIAHDEFQPGAPAENISKKNFITANFKKVETLGKF
jgi:hypothetical protein